VILGSVLGIALAAALLLVAVFVYLVMAGGAVLNEREDDARSAVRGR
jgi:hypothetical protein